MATTAQSAQKRKQTKKIFLVLGAIIALAIIAIATVLIMRRDGTEQFTGVKQEVAKEAVSFEEKNSSISPLPSFMRQIHVDDVRPISADEKSKYCNNAAYVSNDPSDQRYYAVVLSLHKAFESKSETVVQYGCNFLQFDEGYLK